MDVIWSDYKEKRFPRMASILCRAVGHDIPVDVDWDSVGDGTRDLTERLDYDLEMLARGLEGVDRNNPFKPKDTTDYNVLAAGIDRIAVEWVPGIAECKLAVENGTLHL